MLKTTIELQLERLRAPQPALNLVSACRIQEGIIVLSEEKIEDLAQSIGQEGFRIYSGFRLWFPHVSLFV